MYEKTFDHLLACLNIFFGATCKYLFLIKCNNYHFTVAKSSRNTGFSRDSLNTSFRAQFIELKYLFKLKNDCLHTSGESNGLQTVRNDGPRSSVYSKITNRFH